MNSSLALNVAASPQPLYAEDLAIDGGPAVRRSFLPFCRPSFGREEEQAVIETLRSGWITKGPRTLALEAAFARTCGARHAVCLNSCTAALQLAFLAARVGKGDEVITTPMTFAATVNTIVHSGATPVFADVEPDTLNIDPQRIEAAISPRTKAIVPVHMAGQPCDMARIIDIARRYRLMVIEDAAHALGAEYRGQPIGSLSHFTCFSLYATKNITTGEGGVLTTCLRGAAEEIAALALHGLSNTAWERYGRKGYRHATVAAPGFNYVMGDLQAALGECQLEKLEDFWARRRALARRYDAAFADMEELRVLARHPDDKHAYHLYIVELRSQCLSADRDAILNAIQAEGVGLGVHFSAVHLHPYYRRTYPQWLGQLPHAESAAERVLSLPLYPQLSDADVDSVIDAVTKVVRHYRR
jgi:dTDP-4-amino-4,6-dideoxygalactose transaminase